MEEVKETVAVVEAVVESLSVEQLSELVGRPVKDLADFKSHYSNLKSFVGKKVEPASDAELQATKAELEKTKAWFADAGLEIDKANPFEIAKIAKSMAPRQETSSTSASPSSGKMDRVAELGKRVIQRDRDEDRVALVAEALGMGKNINPSEQRVADHIAGVRKNG
jgi:hypothetical protein